MLIVGLDGKEHSWNLSMYCNNDRANASSGHKRARGLLVDIFPFDQILEELTLPGSGRFKLYADFFVPAQMLMIEVQGQQHFEFNPFFHKTKYAFYKAKQRDKQKVEWCKINNIDLIALDDKETEDEWRTKIIQRTS